MRISDNMFTQGYLTSINNTRSQISKVQQQIASGKRVQNPSDDPAAADRILRTKGEIAKNDQYQSNVSDATGMVTATSSALDNFASLLLDAKNVLTKAVSGGPASDLQTYADQIDQILKSAVQTANSQFNGKYLFGGTQTTSPPFILAADGSTVTANPNGITGNINIQINDGVTQTINIDGQQAFLGTQIFQTLIDVRNSMRSGNVPTPAQIDTLNSQISHVTDMGGTAGYIQSALDLADKQLTDRGTQLASMLSNDQDTDYAGASIQLQKSQTMLNAALAIGARLLPQTLLDFLK